MLNRITVGTGYLLANFKGTSFSFKTCCITTTAKAEKATACKYTELKTSISMVVLVSQPQEVRAEGNACELLP